MSTEVVSFTSKYSKDKNLVNTNDEIKSKFSDKNVKFKSQG